MKILFLTRKIATTIGEKEFLDMKLANVICLEEVHQVFPFVGVSLPWDETREDALHMVALVLRAVNLYGVNPSKLNEDRLAATKEAGISMHVSSTVEIPKLWLLTQFYRPEKARREREIKKCLEMNVKCAMVDKVVLLNEKDFSNSFPQESDKIKQVDIQYIVK